MTTATCPVPWCESPRADCEGDHYATHESDRWPGITATAYKRDGAPRLSAAPTWTQCDGLEPAVTLWMAGGRFEEGRSVDLRPKEARHLARALTLAAEAAEGVAG